MEQARWVRLGRCATRWEERTILASRFVTCQNGAGLTRISALFPLGECGLELPQGLHSSTWMGDKKKMAKSVDNASFFATPFLTS